MENLLDTDARKTTLRDDSRQNYKIRLVLDLSKISYTVAQDGTVTFS